MRAHSRWFMVLCLALAPVLASAAEEAESTPAAQEDEDRIGWVVVEASAWLPRAIGAGFDAALQTSVTDSYDSRLASIEPESSESGRYRAGYSLSRNLGDIMVTWWTHEVTQRRSAYTPGVFQFGELFVNPLMAGVFDDGLADGYDAGSVLEIRDLRIDYSRIGFESQRATLRWILGWRGVTHRQITDATYYCAFPVYDGTPIFFPIPADSVLAPAPDVASGISRFNGNGPEVGFQIDFPLHPRVRVEAGLVVAFLDGTTDTSYSSRTSAYYVLVDLNSPAIDYFPLPPFPEFETTNEEGEPYLPLLRQLQIPIQIQASEQTTVQVLDSNLTLRWKIWRELEAFFGVKVTRYDGAATEIRAKAATLSANGVYNVQDATRVRKTTSYEGFLGGLTYRF